MSRPSYKAGQSVQFMIARKKRRQQAPFGFRFRHGLIAVPLNNFVRKSTLMEIFLCRSESVRRDSISEYAAWRCSSAYGSRLVVFEELGCKGSL